MSAQKKRLQFNYFPDYAAFLLKHKLDEFVRISFEFSREENLAIMKLLAGIPEEQLFALGKAGVAEMLEAIADNEPHRYIDDTVSKWISNQLPVIARNEIIADDISMGAFVRRRLFRHFVKEYIADAALQRELLEEVDRFTTETELMTFNAYITIQKEELEIKNAELRHREEQLLEAQKMAEMGSFLWDMSDPSKSVYTPQVLHIFGMKQSGRLEDFFQFVNPADQPLLKAALDNALNNQNFYQCEYRYNRHGEEIYIDSKGIVEFENGKPLRMRGTVRDITKKRRMLLQLSTLNENLSIKNIELERTNKELESFNYIASHDLQEPLRKIQTFSGRLQDNAEMLPKNLLEYVDKINASAVRMKDLIEDLLAFSQITSPAEAFEPVDLNDILSEAQNALSESIEKYNVKIQSDHLPSIKAIPFQFSQLFINLISNSIKYKQDHVNPQIRISARKAAPKLYPEKDYLCISISDNGIGFDPEYSEKIFELFKRLHPKEKYSGTGIGLSICKKIVQNHDGLIFAESNGNAGSSFQIYLPEERLLQSSGSLKAAHSL
jgi:hypothetical protein